jgi:hypothetical protein
MRIPVVLLAAAMILTGCGRVDQLEARLAEVKAENERLARDVADLRRSGTGGGGPRSQDRSLETDAVVRALVDRLAEAMPAGTERTDGELGGVWRTEPSKEGPEIVMHLGPGGGLCGYKLLEGNVREKLPFWGRYERHGRLLLELRDRWVGDHNEHDATLHTIDLLAGDQLRLTSAGTLRLRRLAPKEYAGLRSLYPDRDVAIPGLPKWCFAP